MSLSGDFVIVKMSDGGGTLRTFANGDIISVDPTLTYDQVDVTGFGSEAHDTILGQVKGEVTLKGYLTTTPSVGTHPVISSAYRVGNQVTFRAAVGNNATPQVGVDPEYSGTFIVESYVQSVEAGKAVTFTATLKPATGTAPTWAVMA
jgi:Flp pilus assembly protein TadG